MCGRKVLDKKKQARTKQKDLEGASGKDKKKISLKTEDALNRAINKMECI